MSSQEVAPRQTGEPAPLPPELITRLQAAVAGIPGDDGSGGARIVEQLLNATDIDGLNAPWESTSGRDLAGKTIECRSLSQRPSQYEDGAGIFLVVEGTDAKTGDKTTFTTSAVGPVIQLATAWNLGMFPVTVEVVAAKRPTARGFVPYHLRIIGAGRAQPAPATAGEAPF